MLLLITNAIGQINFLKQQELSLLVKLPLLQRLKTLVLKEEVKLFRDEPEWISIPSYCFNLKKMILLTVETSTETCLLLIVHTQKQI